jgi:hypothetical protein
MFHGSSSSSGADSRTRRVLEEPAIPWRLHETDMDQKHDSKKMLNCGVDQNH